MKLIGRTFAILAAALVVVGALLAFSSYSSAATPGVMPAPPAAIQTSGTSTDTTAGAATSGTSAAMRPEHEHGMSNTPSLGGIFEVLKNLAIVGVITLIVTLGKRAFGGKRRPGNSSRRQQAPPSMA